MIANKRQLIIIVDDSTRQYGELLLALTMMRDDILDEYGSYSESGRVGTRDGSVDAAVWDEKHYKDNQYKIGSSARIIFLGDLKSAKPIAANINFDNPFAKYGVLYGSLGNKAIATIDKKALISNKAKYMEFVNDYTAFLQSVSKEFADSYGIKAADFYSDKFVERAKVIEESFDQGVKDMAESVGAVAEILGLKKDTGDEEGLDLVAIDEEPAAEKIEKVKVSGVAAKVIAALVTPIESAAGVRAGIAIAQTNSEITDQQFRSCIVRFYIDELERFLG